MEINTKQLIKNELILRETNNSGKLKMKWMKPSSIDNVWSEGRNGKSFGRLQK